MQRQVIKPQADVPVVVKLDKGPEGQEREGRYGVDYQYTVNHDRGVMWLPREARDQLVRCGAQAGDDVQIVKSMRGRTTFWSVQVVPDPNELASPPQHADSPSNGHRHINGYQRSSGGNGQAPPPNLQRPGGDMIAGYLFCAIDAAIAASAYAKEKHGWPLQFDAEQVRRLAITLMIGAQQREDR